MYADKGIKSRWRAMQILMWLDFLLCFFTFCCRCESDEDKSNKENLKLHDGNSKVENTVLVSGKESKNPGIIDTLRTPQLRKLTLVTAYSW